MQYKLGFMYQEGHGVPPDPRKAAEWFQKAAEQGIRMRNINLAKCIRLAKASFLILERPRVVQKAAEQGDKDAQYKLGQMYQVAKASAGTTKWPSTG